MKPIKMCNPKINSYQQGMMNVVFSISSNVILIGLYQKKKKIREGEKSMFSNVIHQYIYVRQLEIIFRTSPIQILIINPHPKFSIFFFGTRTILATH